MTADEAYKTVSELKRIAVDTYQHRTYSGIEGLMERTRTAATIDAYNSCLNILKMVDDVKTGT